MKISKFAPSVSPGKKFHLDRIPTRPAKGDDSAAVTLERLLTAETARTFRLQARLAAEGKRALLVVLQGMDTSGKDGIIRHVFAGLNPAGVTVTAFKVPTEEERRHDFLWRIHRAVPGGGTIGIFNRSHYEDVLVVRVHELASKDVIEKRYDQINAFEKHLSQNGVTILKFFLHISKEEQKHRLEERLADPDHLWKFNPGDLGERKLWMSYQDAYENALDRCNTKWAAWRVVPADSKPFARWIVAKTIRKTLQALDPKPPKPAFDPKTIKIV